MLVYWFLWGVYWWFQSLTGVGLWTMAHDVRIMSHAAVYIIDSHHFLHCLALTLQYVLLPLAHDGFRLGTIHFHDTRG